MSPRTPEQNQRLKARTEEKILQTALELFSRLGFAGTSVRKIAKEAGISLGLIYNYFESKEVLLLTLFSESMAEVRATFELENEHATVREEWLSLLAKTEDLLKKKLRFLQLFYSLRTQTRVVEILGPAVAGSVAQIQEKMLGITRRMGISNPETEARILAGALEGICQHYVLDPENYPLGQTLGALGRKYEN